MTLLQIVTVVNSYLLLLPVSNGAPLYFGLMIGDQDDGAKMGVDCALDRINNIDLIPGHTLQIIQESWVKCNRTMALNELFRSILPHHNMVAFIGSGCSAAIEATAEVSHYYNVTQISCASSSDELSDRVRFPYYFQLLPSEVNLAHVFYSIIKEYGWRRVALIVQNEQRYRNTASNLKDLSKNDSNITYTVKLIGDDGLSDNVDRSLLDSQVRIFAVISDSKRARRVICKAYQLGLKYPKHLFLTYGSYEFHWWATNDSQVECTPTEIAEVLQFSLAALHFPLQLSDDMESSDMAQCLQRERHRVVSNQLEVSFRCYDATLTLGHALKNIFEEPTLNPNSITNRNNNFAQLMKTCLETTSFNGITGPVHFDENGIRNVAELRVLQYRTTYINGTPIDDVTNDDSASSNASLGQQLRMVEVAYMEFEGNRTDLEFLEVNFSIWPSYIPHDGVPKSEPSTVILPVTVVVITLNGGGIVFALFCLLFNIIYRKKKLIRLNSPNLNYLMIAGVILLYFSAISFAIPTASPPIIVHLCFTRMWLLTFGYFCGFGAIVAKLWRIYHIFRNPKAKGSGIRDGHLMVFMLIIFLLNIVAMSIHIILEGLIARFNVARIPNAEISKGVEGELEIPVNFFVYQCSSHLWIRLLMQAIIVLSITIMQLCALYLAFQTRKVKVKGLNDAKYTAAVVCITTIVLFVTIILTFTLSSNRITTYIAIYGIGLWISATILLAIMFVPKMVSLFKDPEGEKIFTAHVEALQGTTALGRLINDDLLSMKRKLKQMEDVTEEYRRVTGLDLLPKSQLTTSMSMMNLCANDGNNLAEELRTVLRQRCKK